MPSSGIIDLVIGLTFVFGVAAALASFLTELITRLIGLRAAYLLTGLHELVDGGGSSTTLVNVAADYQTMRAIMQSSPVQAPASLPSGPPPPEISPIGLPKPQFWQAARTAVGLLPQPDPRPVVGPSATGALLGGPILSNQGIAGQFSSRKLTLALTFHRG